MAKILIRIQEKNYYDAARNAIFIIERRINNYICHSCSECRDFVCKRKAWRWLCVELWSFSEKGNILMALLFGKITPRMLGHYFFYTNVSCFDFKALRVVTLPSYQ